MKILLKRRNLWFIKANIQKSNLITQMIGYKLGEFSHKKIGSKIMIRQGIKKKNLKINKDSGSSGEFECINSFRI